MAPVLANNAMPSIDEQPKSSVASHEVREPVVIAPSISSATLSWPVPVKHLESATTTNVHSGELQLEPHVHLQDSHSENQKPQVQQTETSTYPHLFDNQ